MCDIVNTDNNGDTSVRILKLEREYLRLKRNLLASHNNCLRQKIKLNTRERRQLKAQIREVSGQINSITQPSLFADAEPF